MTPTSYGFTAIRRIAKLLVSNLELTPRAANCLKNEDIKTIRDLLDMEDRELLKIPNFGRKSLNEINEALKSTFGIDRPTYQELRVEQRQDKEFLNQWFDETKFPIIYHEITTSHTLCPTNIVHLKDFRKFIYEILYLRDVIEALTDGRKRDESKIEESFSTLRKECKDYIANIDALLQGTQE